MIVIIGECVDGIFQDGYLLPELGELEKMRVYILYRIVLYFGGSAGILESVDGFIDVGEERRETGDDECFAVASETVLEESSEFALSVGDMVILGLPGVLFRECADDSAEDEQALVDVDALLEHHSDGSRLLDALAARQVHHVQLPHQELRDSINLCSVVFEQVRDGVLLDRDAEDGVRPTGRVVHQGHRGAPVLDALLQESHHLVVLSGRDLLGPVHTDLAVPLLSYPYIGIQPFGRLQQVVDLLVVYFQKAHFHDHFPPSLQLVHLLVNLLDHQREYARLLIQLVLRNTHRVCLPTPSLSVSQNSRVITRKTLSNQLRPLVFEYLFLVTTLIEHSIENKLTFTYLHRSIISHS